MVKKPPKDKKRPLKEQDERKLDDDVGNHGKRPRNGQPDGSPGERSMVPATNQGHPDRDAAPRRPPGRGELSRQDVRAMLADAGVLATDVGIPADIRPVSDAEIRHAGSLGPNARSSDDIIDEERGRY